MTKQTNAKTSKKGGKTMDGLKQQQLHYNWKQSNNSQKGMHYQLLDNVQLEQVRAMLKPHQLLILNKVWNIIDQFDRYIYHYLNKKSQTVGKVYKHKQLTKEQLDKAYELGYTGVKDYKPIEVLGTLEYYLGQLDAKSDYLEMGDNTELYNNNTLQLEQQRVKDLINKAKEIAESYACDKAYEYWEQLDTLERQDPAEQQAHIEVYNEAFHQKYLELTTK